MERITSPFLNVLNINFFGFDLRELFLFLLSLIIALIIRGIFASLIISKIKKIVRKTGNKVDDELFFSLSQPLKFLPIVIVFILISFYVDINSNFGFYFQKINHTLISIFVFWFILQSLHPLSQFFESLEKVISKALVLWLTKSIKYFIMFLGIVAVLEIWGIKIGPIIAGLGLFGVAVALGAQDLFKNLISGVLILIEKRFNLGEVIEVRGQAIGTVEHIGFRSTKIRQFDTTSISIPNYVFSDSSIINYSKRKFRRVKWTIGLTYETSVHELKTICADIESFIANSKDFHVSDDYRLFVRVDKFNDSSIDILVHAFANTSDWSEYLTIKEDLALQIKKIVEKNNSSFAFPSTSIYLEKK